MTKLRHIALAVKDLQESAKFYEEAFGMKRVRESDVAVMMSDGVVSLALLDLNKNNNAPDERDNDYVGLHHMGFMVDIVPERKYRDPNGIVIDVTGPEHVAASWRVPFE